MWQIQYYLATEMAAERTRESRLARLAREVEAPHRRPVLSRVRRVGAMLAARIARGLDACVAQEAFARSASASSFEG
jgi:hypothetical protein